MGEWTAGVGFWTGKDKTLDLLKYAEATVRQKNLNSASTLQKKR
jgi:hypothetical protein